MSKTEGESHESKTHLAAEAFRRSRLRIKDPRKSDVLFIIGLNLRGEYTKEETFKLLEYYSSKPRAANLVKKVDKVEQQVEEELSTDFLRVVTEKF